MRRHKEVGLSLTLGQLLELSGVLQSVCKRCGHQKFLYPADLIDQFGADTHSVELQTKMKCTKCGARRAKIYDSTR